MAHARFWSRVAGVTPALRLTNFGPFEATGVQAGYWLPVVKMGRSYSKGSGTRVTSSV